MRSSEERGTRERILEVAESFLGECGYHGTRLHLIAQRVGIQKASLFHYFPSKEHLYRAVLEEGFGETEQTLKRVLEAEASPLDKARLLTEAYVDMVSAHPHRTKIFLRQSLGDAPSGYQHGPEPERLLSLVVSFVAEGQQAHGFAAIDPVGLVLGVVAMVAFFFTSAPSLAPAWCGDPWCTSSIERVKRHVVEVVHRCLTAGDQSRGASPKLAFA
jgi:AcrR family transcriptional regulator